jgi:hypothetical protein
MVYRVINLLNFEEVAAAAGIDPEYLRQRYEEVLNRKDGTFLSVSYDGSEIIILEEDE